MHGDVSHTQASHFPRPKFSPTQVYIRKVDGTGMRVPNTAPLQRFYGGREEDWFLRGCSQFLTEEIEDGRFGGTFKITPAISTHTTLSLIERWPSQWPWSLDYCRHSRRNRVQKPPPFPTQDGHIDFLLDRFMQDYIDGRPRQLRQENRLTPLSKHDRLPGSSGRLGRPIYTSLVPPRWWERQGLWKSLLDIFWSWREFDAKSAAPAFFLDRDQVCPWRG